MERQNVSKGYLFGLFGRPPACVREHVLVYIKPGFHISELIGDLLSGIAKGENDFRNSKDFIHR